MAEITVIPSTAHLPAAEVWLHAHPARLTLDTETTGLDVFAPGFQVGVVALGHSDGAVLAFPGRDRGLVRQVLIRAAAGDRPLWAHNAVYDAWALRITSGVKLSRLRCSLVAARVAYPDRFTSSEGFSLKTLRPTTQTAQDALQARFAQTHPDPARRSDWLPSAVRGLAWDTPELLAYVGEDTVEGARLVDGLAAHAELRQFMLDEVRTDQIWRWQGFDGIRVDHARLRAMHDAVAPALAAAEAEFGFQPWTSTRVRQAYVESLGVTLARTKTGALRLGKRERPTATVPDEATEAWGRFCAAIDLHADQTQVAQLLASGGLLRSRIAVNGAVTGRSTSAGPNLQNFSPAVRETVLAAPGCVLVGADLSHVEPSVLAAITRDPLLVEHCAPGRDVYVEVAAIIWGGTALETDADGAPTAAAAKLRKRAKIVFLALTYGMGNAALAATLGTDEGEAKRIRASALGVYTGLAWWSKDVTARAKAGERLTTLAGRPLPLLTDAAYRAVNYVVQGSAADIFKAMTREIAAGLPAGARVLIPVHDELIVECREEDADPVAALIRTAMHVEIDGVPVWGDPEIIGTRWRK